MTLDWPPVWLVIVATMDWRTRGGETGRSRKSAAASGAFAARATAQTGRFTVASCALTWRVAPCLRAPKFSDTFFSNTTHSVDPP